MTRYDPWFLEQIRAIVAAEAEVRRAACPMSAKACSNSRRWASPTRASPALRAPARPRSRRGAGRRASIRCSSGSTPARGVRGAHAVLYSCYETGLAGGIGAECEAAPSERRKVILGGGPNRIGQGIEFDYCCVHAAFGLAEAGIETIMVNCNPETVSTDYDTSDRLYFEPLTAEDVLEIVRVEASRGELCGVIVQLGGQTPLKLAQPLADAGVPILGTSPARSIWPRTGSAFRSCCAVSACASRRTTSATTRTRRCGGRSASAFPW